MARYNTYNGTKIHPNERHIGTQLRQRRKALGLSQKQLGAALFPPISPQQIQKYECGTNRISSTRLFELSQLLEISPLYFFNGLNHHSS